VQEFTPSPDPDYKRKKRLRNFAVRLIGRPGCVVLFQDETGNFAVKPRTGSNWMPGEKRKTVPEVQEKRRRVGVYGVLDVAQKRVYWKCTTSRTAVTTIAFLKSMLVHYHSERYVVIIWDNAPGHTAAATRQWAAQWNETAHEKGLPKIILLYLPVKAPWLNRIEPVWWGMFRSVIAGQSFDSPQEMEGAIDDYFIGRNERLVTAA
jgi:transposase